MSDIGESNVVNEITKAEDFQMKEHDIEPQVSILMDDEEGFKLKTGAVVGDCKEDVSYEVNMEAALDPDDVIRAGGFGATDDIGSFLPVAMDATDFEASLREAREFEGTQEEICRPGLGWKEPINSNNRLVTQM